MGRLIFYPLFVLTMTVIFKNQLLAYFTESNGFDLSNPLIKITEIHHGGPAKDGIPAIDRPHFIKANKAYFLNSTDRILGLSINGVTKAYPIKILNYHEIVNDFFKNKAVVITYCPLCGSGIAFSAHINGKDRTFGVSGLLYNSDVLLYDRETNSLWSQILASAVTGEQSGTPLKMLALTHTPWRDWKKQYPNSLVLSDHLGFERDYNRSPYGGYTDSQHLYFPVSSLNSRYHPKEKVIGLHLKGIHKVYPFTELAKVKSPYQDTVAGQKMTLIFNAEKRTGKILDQQQKEIPTTTLFWFAWMTFYPESLIFNR